MLPCAAAALLARAGCASTSAAATAASAAAAAGVRRRAPPGTGAVPPAAGGAAKLHTSAEAAAREADPPSPSSAAADAADAKPLLSEDGAARLCSPTGDVAAALTRAPSLRLLQQHYNINVPGLRGQAVLARVVRSSGTGGVLLDPGYYGLTPVPAADLGAATAYNARGEPLPTREGGGGGGSGGATAPRLRRGSYVRVRLGQLFSPYGDVQLEPVRVRPEVRRKLVWGELKARMNRGSPVWGRVLNPCAGGYAVGVAGYVALLPSKQASIHNIEAIGTLQQFYVYRMEDKGGRRAIELSNYADGGAGGGAALGAGAGASEPGGGAAASLWSNL
ncbi:hypothetical protein Rsub_11448 [Raphidocelis subcapitata]|uniref:S1 motif domain-containing protein n=1 Tax=Raphidocelis subcapitata TaxID=307507 RepID=A0A2V0PG71_9CHLO|nr:hypothetical protein Rsub_11448 [Raphidocelis subcapitata]|eukprot:GBF98844.1 hypothetical protein Rsub_11448 [Raphidocelis subcapitata]